MRTFPSPALAAALVAAGLLAGRALTPLPSLLAEQKPEERPAALEVINSSKSNETLAFVYEPESHRLLMYQVQPGTGGRLALSLAAVRNTTYDARISELNNVNAEGTSVKDLKKAVEEEEAKDREAARKRAEEEAKKAKAKGQTQSSG